MFSFSSALLSRNSENKINSDNYVVIENVPDEIDSTIIKNIQPEEHITENKIEKDTLNFLESPEENHLQYIRFNEYEISNISNKKFNSVYSTYSDSTSESSSSDSISYRNIILTPIEENDMKLSNGYVNLI